MQFWGDYNSTISSSIALVPPRTVIYVLFSLEQVYVETRGSEVSFSIIH